MCERRRKLVVLQTGTEEMGPKSRGCRGEISQVLKWFFSRSYSEIVGWV